MAGYSTVAEVRRKLCFQRPILREPGSSDVNGKFTVKNFPIADIDADGVYTDDVIVVKASDGTSVTVSAVNHLTGEVTVSNAASTNLLVSYHFEKNGHANAISDIMIQNEIEETKALIDSRLNKIYQVPFSLSPNSPPEISKVSSDISSARLLMQLYTTASEAEHNWAKERLQYAEEFLQKLESGQARIISLSVHRQAKAQYEDTEPIFNMGDDTYRDRVPYGAEVAEGMAV